ncbi:replicative DNA helicase [Balneicella halophila]|uniref:Replicative DNA helicase n=1 Tax=Balneicella halophila TaxID=1537566 RepID=A0A7L4UMX9_BALHA|nr:replicative DNA helicase [Balneicella halophila]PVX49825.1 replicative DNA helicase [Balneicella halophila]
MAKQQQQKKKYVSIDQLASQIGKVPPQAIEIEEAVLGALLLEKDAVVAVGDILNADSFYKEAHQHIYNAIFSLNRKGENADMLTVVEELKRMELLEAAGGAAYVAQLTNSVASAAHVETHARIIHQKFIQRELIRVSSEIQTDAYDESEDVAELLDKAQQDVFDIAAGNIRTETKPIKPLIDEALDIVKELANREDGLSGVPSGFTELDRITAGWQNSDLVIIAARPAMGKTAFVLSMARNMAIIHKAPIAIFSLEMSSIQLVNRLIASETELGSEKLRSGDLKAYEWEQLNSKIKDLVEAPIYIDDTPALSIFELRAKARRLKQQYNIGCLVIDYLQLMSAGNVGRGNREQEVSLISRQLKIIAKELNIPVIALSQLNRGVEQRADKHKKPMLSDLRESGAIEQDADMVLFIHRPEVYGKTDDDNGNSLIGIANIIIAKHRNGAIGEISLNFRKELAKFSDLEDKDYSDIARFGSRMNDNDDGGDTVFDTSPNDHADFENFRNQEDENTPF